MEFKEFKKIKQFKQFKKFKEILENQAIQQTYITQSVIALKYDGIQVIQEN